MKSCAKGLVPVANCSWLYSGLGGVEQAASVPISKAAEPARAVRDKPSFMCMGVILRGSAIQMEVGDE